ncbi:hypothetical protein [Anoxynatronum sibiricum]
MSVTTMEAVHGGRVMLMNDEQGSVLMKPVMFLVLDGYTLKRAGG